MVKWAVKDKRVSISTCFVSLCLDDTDGDGDDSGDGDGDDGGGDNGGDDGVYMRSRMIRLFGHNWCGSNHQQYEERIYTYFTKVGTIDYKWAWYLPKVVKRSSWKWKWSWSVKVRWWRLLPKENNFRTWWWWYKADFLKVNFHNGDHSHHIQSSTE